LDKFTLYNDDCLNALKLMEDNSIDSCVTDPPYGLSFMGKAWDYDVPKTEIWKEVFRVLKPGAHLLAFFGSRTYHRGVVQIEDAGFEIRDQIMWLYGSGFPKSHNIGKAIDAAAGAKRQVVGTRKHPTLKDVNKIEESANAAHGDNTWKREWELTAPATEDAAQWEGWGTALKPAHEPIVVARKPITQSVAKNVLEHGTGAINIDECRVGVAPDDDVFAKNPNTKGGFGHGNAAVYGDSEGAPEYDPSKGRWPANVIHDGSDEVVQNFPESNSARIGNANNPKRGGNSTPIWGISDGRETNDYRDSVSAARFFYCAKASKSDKDEGLEDFLAKKVVSFQTGGGASGKPSSLSAGRNTEYKNIHPTVKPTDLMKYLCRLVTPKNGTVLDPFMGSGTTGKAAAQEGFKFIGVEMSPEYFEIAEARIKNAYEGKTVNLEEFFS
jgi:site-specific DNA-methyltransferase (adenine-specific)